MADENGITIEDPGTGDVFADEALDVDILSGTLRIRFGVAKMEKVQAPSKQKLVHIGRLIMPMDGARRLAKLLNDVLNREGVSLEDVPPGPAQTLN